MTTRCAICGIPRADHGSRHQIDVLTARPLSDEGGQ